ncbi:MAG: TrmH family RNA methyltransferase [Candidatus Bipolaricaulia bacterium]
MFDEPLYVICHNIRSLWNVGSIFRTSDAAEVRKVFLGGYTGHPPRDRITKTALGADEWIPWEGHRHTWRFIERLQAEGVTIVALENNVARPSEPIEAFRPTFPMALMLGNEVRGLSRRMLKRADQTVHLPMYGRKESLNVAVAYGIAVYELNRHRA